MSSLVVILTAIESGFGFLLTSMVLYFVLSRGRKPYHYLFATLLLICVNWDLGVFLLMIRNEHLEELVILGRIAILPCALIPALIFHFANLYTGRPIKWAVTLIWALTGAMGVLILAGVYYQIEGVYTYEWGNIFKVVPSVLDPVTFVFWFAINLWACWLLFSSARRVRHSRNAASLLEQRHYLYIISGFLIFTFTVVKAFITMGINLPFLLPLGMFLSDIFISIIGVAIIKDRLFDITVIVKKSALYSALAAILIFVFSFSEHVLITYFGKLLGGHSEIAHFVSIAIGIAVLMPLKQRLEHGVEKYFAQKKLEF